MLGLADLNIEELQGVIHQKLVLCAGTGFRNNNYGVVVGTRSPTGEFLVVFQVTYRSPMGGDNPIVYYIENATGKGILCAATGFDTDYIVKYAPHLIVHGAFPHPGGVIDATTGIIVGTSGFEGDEDHQFSTEVLELMLMQLRRIGQELIDDAHLRGKTHGAVDRFVDMRSKASWKQANAATAASNVDNVATAKAISADAIAEDVSRAVDAFVDDVLAQVERELLAFRNSYEVRSATGAATSAARSMRGVFANMLERVETMGQAAMDAIADTARAAKEAATQSPAAAPPDDDIKPGEPIR